MRKAIILLFVCSAGLMAQTAAAPIPVPNIQFFDNIGGFAKPLALGTLSTFAAGTTSPLAAYTDSNGNVALPVIIPININGYATTNAGTVTGVWIKGACYKFTLKRSTGAEIWTQDNVCNQEALFIAALAASSGSSLVGYIYPGGTAETVQSKLRQTLDIRDFGALCNNSADDRSAIQATFDAGGENAIITFPAGTCLYGATLRFYRGVSLIGHGGPQALSGKTVLKYTGTAGSPGIQPNTLAQANINLLWQSISFDGNGLANPTAYLFRVGESTFINVGWFGARAGGSGVVLDGDTNAFEARNVFLNNKWDTATAAKGMVFQNAANSNTVIGGFVSGGLSGFSFLSSSVDNNVYSTDFEGITNTCVISSAVQNRFYGISTEDCTSGIDLSGGGLLNVIRDPNIAGTVTTPIIYPAGAGEGSVAVQFFNGSTGDLFDSMGYFRMTGAFVSGATATYVDPQVQSNTSTDVLNYYYNVDTSGTKQINFYGGTAGHHLPFSFNLGTGVAALDDVAVNVGGAVNHAVCLTAARKIGYCSDVVAADGSCTCN